MSRIPKPRRFELQQTVRADGAVVIAVRGELDLHTAPRLGDTRDQLAGQYRDAVLDLSGVEFVDLAADVSSPGARSVGRARVEHCLLWVVRAGAPTERPVRGSAPSGCRPA